MTSSFLISLKCSKCDEVYSSDEVQTICQVCRSTLLAQYDLEAAGRVIDRDEISTLKGRMWRWKPILPVLDYDNIVTLGEGDTPLLKTDRLGQILDFPNLFIKDESSNPTGTFKARGLASAISKANEFDIHKVIIPTAGNAGGAMAAYAARSGMQAQVLMPDDSASANIQEAEAYGGEVKLVKGLINDAGQLAINLAFTEGWFNVATFREPYRVEGKKIMAYEIAEAFNWELPEVFIYPTGGGTGLVGMWNAFHEMLTMGWLEKEELPRMVAVQSEGCAPVVKAFESGADKMEYWPGASTIASGLRVPDSFAGHLILSALRESQGIAIAVSDSEILEALKQLATSEGIFAAPEGAATLAGFKKLLDSKWIKTDERVVLFNTGTGLKYIK
ncbi:MAG: threonine synthase [Chloroflexi bacterium]|nr:threonine synthase [Chloroflexota bacterium]